MKKQYYIMLAYTYAGALAILGACVIEQSISGLTGALFMLSVLVVASAGVYFETKREQTRVFRAVYRRNVMTEPYLRFKQAVAVSGGDNFSSARVMLKQWRRS